MWMGQFFRRTLVFPSPQNPKFSILTHLNSFGVNKFYVEIFMCGGAMRLRSMLSTSLDKFLKNDRYLDYEFISLCFFFFTLRYFYILCFVACKAIADVAFIVDSSGSIGRRRWPLVLDFLRKIVNEFNVGPDGTHVAVVAYSTNSALEFTFNTLTGGNVTAEEYGKLIGKIRFQRGYTHIDKALKMADEQVFVTSAGMRPNVPKV